MEIILDFARIIEILLDENRKKALGQMEEGLYIIKTGGSEGFWKLFRTCSLETDEVKLDTCEFDFYFGCNFI